MKSSPKRSVTLALAWALLWLLGSTASLEAKDRLTLRINDTRGAPGEVVAVVIRTYAPRGIGQGQICFGGGSRGKRQRVGTAAKKFSSGNPFAKVERVKVFSGNNDAKASAVMRRQGDMIVVNVSSRSGSINEEDGPLVIVYLRLRKDLKPDARFELNFDGNDTFVKDPKSKTIPLRLRGGKLRIRKSGARLTAAAEGSSLFAGETAEISITTEETARISRGRFAIRHVPDLAGGPVKVMLNRRYGTAALSVRQEPGLILVEFDGSLETFPGELFRLLLPTSSDAGVGTSTPIHIDPSLSHIDGLPLELSDGSIELR